jgi:P-type Ca2+ transporter type 2C
MHVVWLELIIHPTAPLAFQELPPSEKLEPVQRNRRLRFFDWREWTLIALIGTLVTALIVVGYVRSLGSTSDVEHARSMALVALVVASATMTAGLTRLRSSHIAVLATVGSALVLVQVPALASLLHLSPLHGDDWLIAGLGGLVVGSLAALLPGLSGKAS